jgi:hypothetical protein
MKKILLMAAFAGLVASSAFANTYGDDKGKKDKKECAKSEKSCAGEKKEGCAKGEHACCKKKAEASAETNKAETGKTTEKK